MTVTVSTVHTINTLAQAVLATAITSLATTDEGAPERAFVTAAPAPWDCCPFVTVQVVRFGEETTSPFSPPIATGHRTQFGRINLVTFNVTVARCNTESLNADDIEAVAFQVEQDGWALWNGFYDAIRDERFLNECSDVHFDFGNALPNQGGCVGWQFVFRAEIGGIPQAS